MQPVNHGGAFDGEPMPMNRNSRHIRYVVTGASVALLLGLSEYVTTPLGRALGFPRDTAVGVDWFFSVPVVVVITAYYCGKTRGMPYGLVSIFAPIAAYLVGYTIAAMASRFFQPAYAVVPMGLIMIPSYLALGLAGFGVARLRSRRNKDRPALTAPKDR